MCITLDTIVSYVVRLRVPAQWGFVHDRRDPISRTEPYRGALRLLIDRSKLPDDRAEGEAKFPIAFLFIQFRND